MLFSQQIHNRNYIHLYANSLHTLSLVDSGAGLSRVLSQFVKLQSDFGLGLHVKHQNLYRLRQEHLVYLWYLVIEQIVCLLYTSDAADE